MPAGREHDREYDVTLFGATGFTGALTAEYLARNAPAGLRWALAGRNKAKLAGLVERLAAIDPVLADLPVLHADVDDPASLRAVAEASRVVITTVGPYINYGEPLVAACAEAGTDYVDLTGEPEFVDLMYVRYHEKAVASGARIVHCCGFDSIPYDLGVLYTVNQLPTDVPIAVEGFVTASGTFSGGTAHSAITAFSRVRQMSAAAGARRKLEGRLEGRRVSGMRGKPRKEAVAGAWVLPAPTIDPQVVLRSARALPRYGPDFSYGHYIGVPSLPMAIGLTAGAAGLLAAAQLPPARDWLLNKRKPGDGPSAEKRQRSWFRARFVGTGGGKRVVTEVSGGDPGYTETAKMLAESALCLALDDLPATAGQVTTAVAMGQTLVDRLVAAGIRFAVLEGGA